MKILIVTKVFYPSIGGMEKYAYMLAKTFSQLKHSVVILTEQQCEENDNYGFEVIRSNYIIKDLFFCIRNTDFCIISGFSLKYIPFTIFNKHNVIVFHNAGLGHNFQSYIKRIIAKLPILNTNKITVSRFVGQSLNLKHYKTIYNPYEDDIFKLKNDIAKRKGFVFVGRICEEKGVNLLIKAYITLFKQYSSHVDMSLDIIGDGPLRKVIESYITKEYPDCRINFKGILIGKTLNEELNKHKYQIVPSLVNEAFGIVALEGLAAGCIEICSDSDGLQEAIGNNGFLFQKGNAYSLSLCMKNLLELSDSELQKMQMRGVKWTETFSMKSICEQYIKLCK